MAEHFFAVPGDAIKDFLGLLRPNETAEVRRLDPNHEAIDGDCGYMVTLPYRPPFKPLKSLLLAKEYACNEDGVYEEVIMMDTEIRDELVRMALCKDNGVTREGLFRLKHHIECGEPVLLNGKVCDGYGHG